MTDPHPPTNQPPIHPEMPPFVKLADPATYRPCGLDLVGDKRARDYWVDFFCSHIDTILSLGVESAADHHAAARRAEQCRADLVRHFRDFQQDHERYGPVTILTLDKWRDDLLRQHGFDDCFAAQKARENAAMLEHLPGVVAGLDALAADPRRQLQAAIEGVFAGNVFDMGAKATAAQFKDKSPDFGKMRDDLKPRPWRIDGFDAFADRLESGAYRRAVVFIDNAGSDLVLGMTPFIRLLTQRGMDVVVAANERPSLNDVTIAELRELWPKLVEAGDLDAASISLVSSGTGEPLIDLRGVSPELNSAAEDADLVVLEGMGRGVESNLDCDLTCDRLNLAMVKDELIAKTIGGELYDCVCRFEPARQPVP